MLASTGVIGEPLPPERITRILGSLAEAARRWLARRRRSDHDDRYLSEMATAAAEIDGKRVTINGIAKAPA